MLKNKLLLNSMINFIEESFNTKEEMIQELTRYKKEFPYQRDYNYYQYGNMLIYNYDIEEFYKEHNYKIENYTLDNLIEHYKYMTRKAIDNILNK